MGGELEGKGGGKEGKGGILGVRKRLGRHRILSHICGNQKLLISQLNLPKHPAKCCWERINP